MLSTWDLLIWAQLVSKTGNGSLIVCCSCMVLCYLISGLNIVKKQRFDAGLKDRCLAQQVESC